MNTHKHRDHRRVEDLAKKTFDGEMERARRALEAALLFECGLLITGDPAGESTIRYSAVLRSGHPVVIDLSWLESIEYLDLEILYLCDDKDEAVDLFNRIVDGAERLSGRLPSRVIEANAAISALEDTEFPF